jgi:hypothetical protein
LDIGCGTDGTLLHQGTGGLISSVGSGQQVQRLEREHLMRPAWQELRPVSAESVQYLVIYTRYLGMLWTGHASGIGPVNGVMSEIHDAHDGNQVKLAIKMVRFSHPASACRWCSDLSSHRQPHQNTLSDIRGTPAAASTAARRTQFLANNNNNRRWI